MVKGHLLSQTTQDPAESLVRGKPSSLHLCRGGSNFIPCRCVQANVSSDCCLAMWSGTNGMNCWNFGVLLVLCISEWNVPWWGQLTTQTVNQLSSINVRYVIQRKNGWIPKKCTRHHHEGYTSRRCHASTDPEPHCCTGMMPGRSQKAWWRPCTWQSARSDLEEPT